MIYLPEVAETLEKILNGVDTQIAGLSSPVGFEFKVKTAGFHIDANDDMVTKKNFIPVFIDSDGGAFDAVKEIQRQVESINVVMYYPVRFKDDFFAITDYLVDYFVAQRLNYGKLSGKCLSNIGAVRYGEIQGLDLVNFSKWVENNYERPIRKTENYMSLQFTLYLTNLASGFILGNQVKYSLLYSVSRTARDYLVTNVLYPCGRYRTADKLIDGVQYYAFRNVEKDWLYYTKNLYFEGNEAYYTITDDVVTFVGRTSAIGGTGEHDETWTYNEDLVWTSSGTGAANSPISQQLIDVDSYAKNTSNITNYNKSIVAYIRGNEFWKILLDFYNKQEMSKIDTLTLAKTYYFTGDTKLYSFSQLVLSMNENIALGEPVSFTITFGDKYTQER